MLVAPREFTIGAPGSHVVLSGGITWGRGVFYLDLRLIIVSDHCFWAMFSFMSLIRVGPSECGLEVGFTLLCIRVVITSSSTNSVSVGWGFN